MFRTLIADISIVKIMRSSDVMGCPISREQTYVNLVNSHPEVDIPFLLMHTKNNTAVYVHMYMCIIAI